MMHFVFLETLPISLCKNKNISPFLHAAVKGGEEQREQLLIKELSENFKKVTTDCLQDHSIIYLSNQNGSLFNIDDNISLGSRYHRH